MEQYDDIADNLLSLFPLFQRKVLGSLLPEGSHVQLTPAAMHVMLLMNDLKLASVSDLSTQLEISRPNLTPLIDKLVNRKLLLRYNSELDRRVVLLKITASGEELCLLFKNSLLKRVKERLMSLGESDIEQLNLHLLGLKEVLYKFQPLVDKGN